MNGGTGVTLDGRKEGAVMPEVFLIVDIFVTEGDGNDALSDNRCQTDGKNDHGTD